MDGNRDVLNTVLPLEFVRTNIAEVQNLYYGQSICNFFFRVRLPMGGGIK